MPSVFRLRAGDLEADDIVAENQILDDAILARILGQEEEKNRGETGEITPKWKGCISQAEQSPTDWTDCFRPKRMGRN